MHFRRRSSRMRLMPCRANCGRELLTNARNLPYCPPCRQEITRTQKAQDYRRHPERIKAQAASYRASGRRAQSEAKSYQRHRSAWKLVTRQGELRRNYGSSDNYYGALARDNHECQRCGGHSKLLVHHIDGDKANVDMDNFLTLCRGCHLVVHQHEHLSYPYYVPEIAAAMVGSHS